jgi:sortase A
MRTLVLLAVLGLSGAALTARGLWIPTKAALGQVLLEASWARVLAGDAEARPWPWADLAPVARLRVPAHRVDQIVLTGAQGASLAWGPGHVDGTAPPGTGGNVALAGHRDTHFRFLEDLAIGEEVLLETPAGPVRYRVVGSEIVDRDDTRLLEPTADDTLTLITCYPFDALVPGGRLRYVVRAVGEGRVIFQGAKGDG